MMISYHNIYYSLYNSDSVPMPHVPQHAFQSPLPNGQRSQYNVCTSYHPSVYRKTFVSHISVCSPSIAYGTFGKGLFNIRHGKTDTVIIISRLYSTNGLITVQTCRPVRHFSQRGVRIFLRQKSKVFR